MAEDEFFGKLKAQGKALKHVELLKFKVGQLQQRHHQQQHKQQQK